MRINHHKRFSIAQFGEVGSTQTLAKECISGKHVDLNKILITLLRENQFLVLIADSQTSGVGQYSRKWDSPIGNMYMSCIVKLKQCNVINLTQIFTAIIYDMLLEYGIKTQIKWINDILYNEKKLSGVLCEVAKFNGDDILIVGIGINVNVKVEGSESIKNILNKEVDIFEILHNICDKIPLYLNTFFENGISFFLNTLNKNAAYYNQNVIVQQKSHVFEGIFKGYDANGMLIIDSFNGKHILYEGRMSLNSK